MGARVGLVQAAAVRGSWEVDGGARRPARTEVACLGFDFDSAASAQVRLRASLH